MIDQYVGWPAPWLWLYTTKRRAAFYTRGFGHVHSLYFELGPEVFLRMGW